MSQAPEADLRRVVRSPLDLAAGLFLLANGAVGAVLVFSVGSVIVLNAPDVTLFFVSGLRILLGIVAVLVAVSGLALVALSLILEGGPLERVVKSQLDFTGGLFLIALAEIGFAGGFNLPTGTLSGIGSGLVPKSVAVLVGAFGVLLIVQGDIYAQMTAILVLFFAGVLYTYSSHVERLLDESILLRHDNSRLIERLSEEKLSAEGARDVAQASHLGATSPYYINNGRIVTSLVGTPMEIAVYKLGDKYFGARSNEFGYANYEIIPNVAELNPLGPAKIELR